MSFGRAATAAAIVLGCFGCTDEQLDPVDWLAGLPVEQRIEAVLARMTLAEKVEQMHGLQLAPIDGLSVTPENERLGIASFRMVDGPRGVRAGNATAFPVGMARGATWDVELEKRVGAAMAAEASAKQANVLLAPTINIVRHPGWGRAQESYGEDPLHMGHMGVAFINGVQAAGHVLASAKHFALNSIEDTRFSVNVSVDERTLREIYLPHFKMAVKQAAVGSVMSAYNLVNGSYCAENPTLLRDILKDEWAFDGFVESDWMFGTRSTVESALAGLDIEMPSPVFYGPKLVAAVEEGDVDEATIDAAVRRILRKKFEFAIDEPSGIDAAVVESKEHTELALEVARKAIVLLKNDQALPIDRAAVSSVAVVGALADTINLGDVGSSDVTPSSAVTPLAGINQRAGEVKIVHIGSDTLSAQDQSQVAAADATIVVVGLTAEDEGENLAFTGGDRDTLALSAEQQALISAVASSSKRTIVVIEGGSAITMTGWVDEVEAVIMVWYPGMEGGLAIADVLFGDTNPSGKLPLTFPATEEQLVSFDHSSDEVSYGYYHGYRHVDREQTEPRFPFGFGLSYTSFDYEAIALSAKTIDSDGTVTVSVDVRNTGNRAGGEVVQLYVGYPKSAVDRPVRDLRGFKRVSLGAGESTTVAFELNANDLAYYDDKAKAWQVETMDYTLWAGSSCRDLPLSATLSVD